MIRSLRLRLLISTSLAMIVVLGLLGVTIYFSVRSSMLAEFDRGLIDQARALAAMAEQDGQRVTFEFDPQLLPEFTAHSRPEYFEARLKGGSEVTRSQSLGSHDLASTRPDDADFYENVLLPNGHAGRLVSVSFNPRVEPAPGTSIPVHSAVVMVARETSALHHTMRQLRWLLIALFGGAIVISGGVLIAVVGRAMKPVYRLAREIEGLAETNLANRLQRTDVPEELTPVIDKLNGLFERLQRPFAREKSFSADVAHELRTPLAGLGATLEVCRSRPRDSAAYEVAIDKCKGITDRMQEMVETLLLLGRAEAGELALEKKTFDLCLLLHECWAAVQDRAEARQLRIDWNLPAHCELHSDREKLIIVIQNLFGNAVSYCNDGGNISITIATGGAQTCVEIANSGSQVPPDDVNHLFERFWRRDPSRSETGVHYGLGLALCQRLMNIMQGQITIHTSAGGVFHVRLNLP